MHSYTTDTIVLKRWDYGEADRVLTLYTANRGRVSAIARGARKPKSKIGGHLEPFAHSILTLSEGRTFDTVVSAQLVLPHAQIAEKVIRINAAHYVAEAVLRLTAEAQTVERLFELLCAVYRTLNQAQKISGILAGFQLKLLSILGHRPILDQCVHCQKSKIRNQKSEVGGFDLEHGGIVCNDCISNLKHQTLPCKTEEQECLKKLLTEPMQEKIESEPGFKGALKIIEQSLIIQTERPLKSREFLNYAK